MVVVVIVSILAVIAVPSVAERLRERRASEVADRVAALYRGARMRAMGRGAAILVRFDGGTFRVLEAMQGAASADADCAALPQSSCLMPGTPAGDWNTATDQRQVTIFNPYRGDYEGVEVSAADQARADTTALDVCYTPLGRAYTRSATSGQLLPMTGVVAFEVARDGGGPIRTVTVLPNGMAKVAARSR